MAQVQYTDEQTGYSWTAEFETTAEATNQATADNIVYGGEIAQSVDDVPVAEIAAAS